MTLCPYGTPSPPPHPGTWLPGRRCHDPVRFGFFGALTRKQGAHVLLEAFGAVPAGQGELHVLAALVDRRHAAQHHRRSVRPVIPWHGPLPRWRRAIVPPKPMEPHVEGIEALYRQLGAARRPRPAPATVGAP